MTCAPLLQKIYYRRSSSSHVDSVGILSSTSRASKTRFTNGISVADNFVPNSDFEPLTSWGLLQKEPGIIPNGKGISQCDLPLVQHLPATTHSRLMLESINQHVWRLQRERCWKLKVSTTTLGNPFTVWNCSGFLLQLPP